MAPSSPKRAKTVKDSNLVWVDCEMTGLDSNKDHLLEIAVIVTVKDSNLVWVDCEMTGLDPNK